MSSLPLPARLRPVTFKCSRVDIELSANAREKLLRRVRHLAGAASLVARLDGANGSIELTAHEKGFLVVAITAWADGDGRNRVPVELLRLHTTLLGDLYHPVDAPKPEPADEPEPALPEPVVEATPVPEPDEAPAEVDVRLFDVRRALEEQLERLGELEDGSLGRARAALRRALAELATALER